MELHHQAKKNVDLILGRLLSWALFSSTFFEVTRLFTERDTGPRFLFLEKWQSSHGIDYRLGIEESNGIAERVVLFGELFELL